MPGVGKTARWISREGGVIESLTECAYLGPVNTNGGGFFGVSAGGSGIGSSERNQVVKFQVGRIIAPVVWRFDDLGWLMSAPVRQEIPRSLPDAVGPFQDPEEDDFGEPALIPKPKSCCRPRKRG